MKIDNQDENYIKELVNRARNILILCANRGNDSLGAGVAIANYIDDHFDKHVSLVYNGDYTHINPELLTLYEIQEELDKKMLKLTIDFSGTDIESVNYYKEDESRLILEIDPVDRTFDTQKRIRTNFVGKDYDLIIVIGADKLESLGDAYTSNTREFDKARIINIDNQGSNENFGKLNIVDPSSKSLSSLMFAKFGEWKYTPSEEASQGLLLGMRG